MNMPTYNFQKIKDSKLCTFGRTAKKTCTTDDLLETLALCSEKLEGKIRTCKITCSLGRVMNGIPKLSVDNLGSVFINGL